METIQVAITDTAYSDALRALLARDGEWQVVAVETPDPSREGVLVLDPKHLERIAGPIPRPERVVLITRNEPRYLKRAWEAGVNSVVFEKDPLNTAILAIMAARLEAAKTGRTGKPKQRVANCGGPA